VRSFYFLKLPYCHHWQIQNHWPAGTSETNVTLHSIMLNLSMMASEFCPDGGVRPWTEWTVYSRRNRFPLAVRRQSVKRSPSSTWHSYLTSKSNHQKAHSVLFVPLYWRGRRAIRRDVQDQTPSPPPSHDITLQYVMLEAHFIPLKLIQRSTCIQLRICQR
jgi:hypothetical protein